jgi:hypothetical protein
MLLFHFTPYFLAHLNIFSVFFSILPIIFPGLLSKNKKAAGISLAAGSYPVGDRAVLH